MLSRTRTGIGRLARLQVHVSSAWAPRASYSMWDRVRPSLWHPMATLEQSMMELDRMTSHMFTAPTQFAQSMMPRMHADDEEFFRDLMESSSMKEGAEKVKDKAHEKMEHMQDKAMKHLGDKHKQSGVKGDSSKHAHDQRQQSYSSYSYSSSTILDANGHRVTSVRRRYEDSTGRLKAVHEREIDGKKVKSLWKRHDKEDEGKHKTICSGDTSEEEFEREWEQTAFGQASSGKGGGSGEGSGSIESGDSKSMSKPQGVVEAEKASEHITPGPDFEAAEKAPEKECGEEASGVTKDAAKKSREEAIAEGSKNQAEETTPPLPPKYTPEGAPGYT